MRSDITSASPWSCVTNTVVMPSRRWIDDDLDAHLLAQLEVEVRQRLVEQQHRGIDHERARERDALALAARHLQRPAIAEAAELHEVERVLRRACAISDAPTLRMRSPNATFCAAVMCGNSA